MIDSQTMIDWQAVIEHFHFLRPWFLLALPFGFVVLYWVTRATSSSSNWKSAIDANLLSHLIDNPEDQKQQRLPLYGLFLAWIIACVAMAGPSWEQIKQPVIKKQDALILILDLSLSMYAEDQKPSRVINARRKIKDILEKRQEGLTALIVYSGDAHVVSPLTDDTDTIYTMLPALEPSIMPKYGSNLGAALSQAQALLDNAAIQQAQVLLLTDDISKKQFASASSHLKNSVVLSILTFGTESGAPIPLNNSFYKDNNGNTVIAKLNWSDIKSLANKSGIIVVKSSFNDSDINQLLIEDFAKESQQETERQFDLWEDRGHWLSLLLIPFVLLSFRRGWILLVLFIVLPENSYAMEWKDLWQTNDQQAAEAFKRGDIETAAQTFENSDWQASSNYKKGNYEAALEGFSNADDAQSLYNKANTLAKLGQYEEALKAYDETLKQQSDFADASFNKELVEKLLQEKEQEQNQNQEQEQNSDDQQSDQDKNEDGQQSEDQQQSGENQQQSEENQNSQEQQEENQQDSSQENSEDNQQQQEQQSQSQEESDAEEEQNQQAQQQANEEEKENESEEPSQQNQGMPQQTSLEKEQQQALQQWLRKIPDDPGQLLRNKFRYQYEKNRQQNDLVDKESEKLW